MGKGISVAVKIVQQNCSVIRATPVYLLLLLNLTLSGCSGVENKPAPNAKDPPIRSKQLDDLRADIKRIEPFFKPMGKPKAYDWLGSHNEPGQTFEQYINSNPTLPTAERRTIFVLPLGKFTAQQKKVIDLTAGYLEAFYGLPVKELSPQELKPPSDAKDKRQNPYTKAVQTRTGYILDTILTPQLPKDAAALIALTNVDLFPDASMYYVFGQASMENRVGVWSLARLDDKTGYDNFLRRTLKIASHETGHMFGMWHCTKYECVMSGTNYLGETDSRPIDACPECMAKVAWLSNVPPKERYDRLESFCRKNGMTKEAVDFERKSKAIG